MWTIKSVGRLLAFLGFLCTLMLAHANTAQADAFEDGRDALAEERYRQAAQHLEAAAVHDKNNPELLYWLGLAYWNHDDAPRSIEAYERAVASDPKEESLWSLYALENLAMVYTRSDRMEDSKHAYEKALLRETRSEWLEKINTQLAELALAMGTFEADAHTVFNEQGDVVGGVGAGLMRTNQPFEIARHTRDPEKEVIYYREATRVDPGMFQSYFNLGLALTHLGRYEEAISWLEKSDEVWKQDTESNPEGIDKADAHAFLALSYLELGELEAASQHARRANQANPSDYWGRLYAQRVRTATGSADEARVALEGLALGNPEHPETLHALAMARLAAGDSLGAQAALSQALLAIPENHSWMEMLRQRWTLERASLPTSPGKP